jgi:hypothetical protein
MKHALCIGATLAVSSAALAGTAGDVPQIVRSTMNIASAAGDRAGTVVAVPFLSTIDSFDEFTDPSNVAFTVDLPVTLAAGESIVINGIGWNVSLFSQEPSLLDDLIMDIRDPQTEEGFGLAPGNGAGRSGTGTFANPVFKFADFNLGELALSGTQVRIEFYEALDDFPDQADGSWLQGSVVSFQYVIVPTPASAGVLGLAGLIGLRRRRLA